MSNLQTILEIKNHLRQDINNDVLSIKVITPTTFLSIPYAIEKISAGFPSRLRITLIKLWI